MFKAFIKLFIKDYDDVGNSLVRQKYGLLSGALGIICNLILFIIKISVGFILGSVAVISDAFNNFSDMGSTVISVIGIKLSNRKPDRDHPFGHGRFEYISALIVAFIIMLVGFELFKSSFTKILNPEEAQDINWLLIGILAISVPVKLFMFGINKFLGKSISSPTLIATALDSRNDAVATGAVIISTIIDGLHILPFVIDGYVGALVSLLIIYAGFSVAKDTVGILLGKAPEKETVDEITSMLLETPEILDIHDLIIHDYGPGRIFASVHAEVESTSDVITVHEAIDLTEKNIFLKTGCEITIHMDPICSDDPILNNIKTVVYDIFKEENCVYTIHDLRMTKGEDNMNIIFDMVVPFDEKTDTTKHIIQRIKEAILKTDCRFSTVIQIDRDFVQTLDK